MEPVLIQKDTAAITKAMNKVEWEAEYLQVVYEAILPLGITATLSELVNLGNWTKSGSNRSDFVLDYVHNGLLNRAMQNSSFNGVPVYAHKLKELIAVPDLTQLRASLEAIRASSLHGHGADGIDVRYLQLVDGVVSVKPTAEQQIEAAHTHYTKTEQSAALATSLLAVCDAMNQHDLAFKGTFANALGRASESLSGALDGDTPLEALKYNRGQFVPSLSYIRSFESRQSN